MKEDRLPSENQGANASDAASTEGGRSTEDCAPKWLRDYKSGMEYEVYSLALHVAEESPLWGLTFGR